MQLLPVKVRFIHIYPVIELEFVCSPLYSHFIHRHKGDPKLGICGLSDLSIREEKYQPIRVLTCNAPHNTCKFTSLT